MNFKTLNDSDLLFQTKNLVVREKEITLEILHSLSEIENRKLFLARGFSSLFDFCVKELGYSEGASNRRISSMRLLNQLPEVELKIKENKVNLSTLSQLHCHIRREEKWAKATISKEEKLELLSQIENKSQDQCQRVLLERSREPLLSQERQRIISDHQTEIKFVASKDLMAKFHRLKALNAHKTLSPSWSEFFELMADACLKKSDPLNSSTAAAAKRCVKKDSRYIPRLLRQRIWQRDLGQCQFVDPVTKRKCESAFALQVDHIHPFALGGETSESNLRLLCRAHNNFRAAEVFGPPPHRSA